MSTLQARKLGARAVYSGQLREDAIRVAISL
jgi:hypothetical protein